MSVHGIALRVVIVEDEEPQRRQLALWLSELPGTTLAGEFADGESAVEGIDAATPDVILLDVGLPMLTGLDVLKRIRRVPQVVFTTAYRDHAIAAFEIGAADYLLKPFGRERLIEALVRARTRRDERDDDGVPPLSDRIAAARDASVPLDRIFVRDRGAIVPVPIDSVERIEADGDYSALVTATRRFLVAIPMATLHERIQRREFVRVHRSHIVNLAHVARIVPAGDGRLRVEMRASGQVPASRAGSQELRRWVG